MHGTAMKKNNSVLETMRQKFINNSVWNFSNAKPSTQFFLIITHNDNDIYRLVYVETSLGCKKVNGKSIPLQAWTGPEGYSMLRLPDFETIGTWRW